MARHQLRRGTLRTWTGTADDLSQLLREVDRSLEAAFPGMRIRTSVTLHFPGNRSSASYDSPDEFDAQFVAADAARRPRLQVSVSGDGFHASLFIPGKREFLQRPRALGDASDPLIINGLLARLLNSVRGPVLGRQGLRTASQQGAFAWMQTRARAGIVIAITAAITAAVTVIVTKAFGG